MIRSNPHTHTQFCDGKSTAREMIESALAHNFLSLGFSSHAPQEIEPEYGMRDEPGYIRHIRELQQEYADRIRIRLGVEVDFEGTFHRPAYDYFLGAVHYVRYDGDRYFVVDGDPENQRKAWHEYYDRDGLAMARDYYQTIVRSVHTMKPTILAHVDLLRKYNDGDNRLFDTKDLAYRRLATDALEAVADTGILLEVNTGGMARGYLPTPYPDLFILEHWRKLGGRVIVGSDCHNAEQIDFAFDTALRLIAAAGYRKITRLSAGETLFEEIDLA